MDKDNMSNHIMALNRIQALEDEILRTKDEITILRDNMTILEQDMEVNRDEMKHDHDEELKSITKQITEDNSNDLTLSEYYGIQANNNAVLAHMEVNERDIKDIMIKKRKFYHEQMEDLLIRKRNDSVSKFESEMLKHLLKDEEKHEEKLKAYQRYHKKRMDRIEMYS